MRKCSICQQEKEDIYFYQGRKKTFCYCIKCSRKKSKLWYRKNAARHQTRQKRRYDEIRIECFTLLGGVCYGCRINDRRVLCIDHVKGGGTKERKQVGLSSYYRHVIKAIRAGSKGYQLLCYNCNHLKRLLAKEN